jgi:transposase
MEEGGLNLTKRDEQRIGVLIRIEAGVLGKAEGAVLLGLSERQVRRLVVRYRSEGPRGAVHGNRGRKPAHVVPGQVRDRVRALASGPYAGVNHSHLSELLAEREGIDLPRSTLSDILREAGIRSPRPQRRRNRHRSRRERYSQEGLLLQIDASLHDWLEGRGPRLTLLGAIDDATSKVVALRFEATEDARGYLLLLRQVCTRTGVPQALYSDRHSIFWPTNGETLQEQLAGRRSPTQFGRAMAELDVQLIAAHSPQAKGRIERLWGTLQDRLVSELRLAGVTTAEEANAYLPAFITRFNRTFGVEAELPGSAYRPRLSKAAADRSLCFKHERIVTRDNIVRLGQVVLQILPGPGRIGYAQAKVTIAESLDHRFSVHFQGHQLQSKLVPVRKLLTPKPLVRRAPPAPSSDLTSTPKHWTPPASHPWRNYPPVTKSLGN